VELANAVQFMESSPRCDMWLHRGKNELRRMFTVFKFALRTREIVVGNLSEAAKM
jgi:hypothetical protein